MLDDQELSHIQSAIEALLFVSSEPVGVLTLAEMIGCEPGDAERALQLLGERLTSENRGIQLREVAGGWRFFTHPAHHDLIEKYVISWDTRRLSSAALETLAIVAYLQPVTRATLASIRGVNSDSTISSLIEKGYIREAGTLDAPGNPIVYGTTSSFLESFGLKSVQDLPELEQFAADDDMAALIRERLSASKVEQDALFDADGTPEEGRSLSSDDENESPFSGLQDAMRDALANMAGAVEKIDFDTLTFDTDDE